MGYWEVLESIFGTTKSSEEGTVVTDALGNKYAKDGKTNNIVLTPTIFDAQQFGSRRKKKTA